MNDSSYTQKAFSKLQLYVSNGILPSIDLITTYESKDHPLDTELVQKIISHYFTKKWHLPDVQNLQRNNIISCLSIAAIFLPYWTWLFLMVSDWLFLLDFRWLFQVGSIIKKNIYEKNTEKVPFCIIIPTKKEPSKPKMETIWNNFHFSPQVMSIKGIQRLCFFI